MNQIIKTFVCASAVTEFALVAIDSAGKIAVATDPTANTIVGVAQRAGDAGDVVDVVIASSLAAQSLSPRAPSSLSPQQAQCKLLQARITLSASASPTSIRPASRSMSSSRSCSLPAASRKPNRILRQ